MTTLQVPDSSIVSTGPKSFIMTGVFLQIIRSHFSDPENIQDHNLKENVWSPDEKFSKILIEPVYKWDAKKIQARPAVIVKRGGWKVQRFGIGDKYMGPPEETGFAEDRYIVGMGGTHVFFCLGNSGLEAEALGAEVFYEMLEFSAIIREQFCLGTFQVSDLGEVSRFEEAHDHFAVPVTVSYAMQHQWKLLRQAPEWMRSNVYIDVKE